MAIPQKTSVYLVSFILFVGVLKAQECRKPLGLQTLGIGNDQISASSEENSKKKTSKNSARLNSVYSWRAGKNVKGEYIQVDLGQMMDVTGMDIQGDHAEDRWVTKFLVKYSTDGVNWKDYKTLNGNTKASEIKEIYFDYELKARYIQVVVVEWHGGISMRLELYGCKETCDKQFVGLGNGKITDNQLSASSHLNENTSPKYARLYKEGAWCASLTDKTPWLQIDLGTLHVLCAVQTQGNSKEDQIVTSFTMQVSNFGQNWADYKEDNKIKVFEGNVESNTIAKNFFNRGILARYARILPTSFIGAPCMRVELYGVHKWACERAPLGVGHPTYDLANHRMDCLTSIHNYRAYDGRLNGAFGWEPNSNKNLDFLQIDVGEPHIICAIDVQGNGQLHRVDERTLSYKISYSMDYIRFTVYPVVLRGNNEYIPKEKTGQVVKNGLIHIVLAKFVRIYPLKYHNYKCLRTEIHGINLGNRLAVGLELVRGKPSMPASRMTARGSYTDRYAVHSRLYSANSWAAEPNSYIQYDLGDVVQLTGIAIQGDLYLHCYVTKYNVHYGFALDELKAIDGLETKLRNRKDAHVNWLSEPVGARYVRLLPKEFVRYACIRTEIYIIPLAPTVRIHRFDIQGDLSTNPKADLDLTCVAFGNNEVKIKWLLSGNDITSKSFDNSYTNRLTTSKVRFGFSDILDEVRKHKSCVTIDVSRSKCTTRVDCVTMRRNANHDRKSYEIAIILDADLNPL